MSSSLLDCYILLVDIVELREQRHKSMAELRRLFGSLENAELAHAAQMDGMGSGGHSSTLNQLYALSAHSHMVKHKYLTTMKDTFAANLARYRDEDLRVRSSNLLKKQTLQIKWPLMNNTNNDKQNDAIVPLQQLKTAALADIEKIIPPPLIVNSGPTCLLDNFDMIKERYASLANFDLTDDGKQLRITFKSHVAFVVLESISNGRQGGSWKIINSMPCLPSFTQLNSIIRQSNHLSAEHLCLIRACLIKQLEYDKN